MRCCFRVPALFALVQQRAIPLPDVIGSYFTCTSATPWIRSPLHGGKTISNGVLLPKTPTCLQGSPGAAFAAPPACRDRSDSSGAARGGPCQRRIRPSREPHTDKPAPQRCPGSDVECQGEFRLPAGRGLRSAAPSLPCRRLLPPAPHVTPPGPKMAASWRAHSRRGRRARLQDGGQWRPPETA